VQPEVAWFNLRGQWLESMLAWWLGLTVMAMLGRHAPGLWWLAAVSAFPIGLHLALSALAWLGLLGVSWPPEMGMLEAAARLGNSAAHPAQIVWFPGGSLSGFRGIEPMHGNIGYAACVTIALLCACAHKAWGDRDIKGVGLAFFGVALCFVSVLIAVSRGAVIFGALVLLVAAAIALLARSRDAQRGATSQGASRAKWPWVLALCVLGLIVFAGQRSFEREVRWYSMVDKVRIGWMVPDATEILCNGLSPDAEQQIAAQFSHRGTAYVEELLGGLKGQDGGRVLLVRAGLQLVLAHPTGLDGSRDSFKKLMEARCGHVPMLQFAHSHDAWVDLALALGWLGALIFACLLVSMAVYGWRALRSSEQLRPWGFALLLVAVFWLVRGFADSVYREHYLQMQALLMGYLYSRTRPTAPQ
jgi:hypothetical protein